MKRWKRKKPEGTKENKQELHRTEDANYEEEEGEGEEVIDFTRIPGELDGKLESFDKDSSLRPTTIKEAEIWTKKYQKSLMSPLVSVSLDVDKQKEERNKAFDLLDALSRSGALSIDHCSLHVLLAFTHCFDKSVMDTVIQDNVNPIEKLEKSTLLVAETIHRRSVKRLIKPEHRERIQLYSPQLFLTDGKEENNTNEWEVVSAQSPI